MSRTRTTAFAIASLTLVTSMTGCDVSGVNLPFAHVTGPLAAGTMTYASTRVLNHGHYGPRVIVRNESAREVAIRLWVGQIDITEPMGIKDLRTDDDLALVMPGKSQEVLRPDQRALPTAIHDAIVWVHYAPADGPEPPRWFAFERGGPFELVFIDGPEGLAIDSLRTSPMTDLPTERRIVARRGEHPVWNSPDAMD